MKATLYRALPKFIRDGILHLQKQIRNYSILSSEYGQWRTICDWSSKNHIGEAIPWYTYPAIEYLSHLELSNFRVFEFGSGNSTIWWGKHALSVRSVEDNPEWYRRVSSQITKTTNAINCSLREEKIDYINALNDQYDITIIDGNHRPECADGFIGNCNKSIMLIFDNSDRYPDTINLIRNRLGWVELDFHGFGPINMYTWTTSIFINPREAHKISYKQQLSPISGLGMVTEG